MNGVSKLSVTEDISLVNFKNIPRDLCISSRIMTEFAEQGINIDMISQSAPTGETADISFTVDSEQVVRALAIVQRFREQYPSLRTSVSTAAARCSCTVKRCAPVPAWQHRRSPWSASKMPMSGSSPPRR